MFWLPSDYLVAARMLFSRPLGLGDKTVQSETVPRFAGEAASFTRHRLNVRPNNFAFVVQSPCAAEVRKIIR
jgi:hypothetical protein